MLASIIYFKTFIDFVLIYLHHLDPINSYQNLANPLHIWKFESLKLIPSYRLDGYTIRKPFTQIKLRFLNDAPLIRKVREYKRQTVNVDTPIRIRKDDVEFGACVIFSTGG